MNKIPFFYVNLELQIINCPSKREDGVIFRILWILSKNQIGDEYHYIFECTNLSGKRNSLLPKHLIERPNMIKFKNVMTNKRKPILQKLCKFIWYINMIVCPICRFTVLVYIVYSLICSFLCNFSVYVLCTISLRNKDIAPTLNKLIQFKKLL
jgi:uncharacterized protein YbaR (Trm112 family)